MSLKFKKKIEDFVCEHCGEEVKGNGFTNHCSQCLWSKHVDRHPGDREQSCGGLMKPIKLVQEKGKFVMTHQCNVCHETKRNRLASHDNFDEALKAVRIAQEEASKGGETI